MDFKNALKGRQTQALFLRRSEVRLRLFAAMVTGDVLRPAMPYVSFQYARESASIRYSMEIAGLVA
jgi:hypothetical protein